MNTVNPKRPRKARGPGQAELRRCRQEYERLKQRLRRVGYICLGSIAKRWLPCGKPSCGCHRDPKLRHGPYYHWTRKVAGRTESRMLSESLARLYREGIRSHRQIDAIIEKMREVSLLAFRAARSQSRG